jgi:transcriptional regulator with XRE-family HTH domain
LKRIGERIRRKRENLHLQLNDLAGKVGISSSALSQIEKAKAFPSIITLKLIANNLYTTVGELIGENETLIKNPVVKREEIKFVEKNITGTELYLLSHHDLNKHMDTYMIRFFKESELAELLADNNSQVFCFVLSGEIQFKLDKQSFLLKRGDSVYFDSRVGYEAINNANEISELLWIISPPAS